MIKSILKVPTGVRYIGNWQDFHLGNFPAKCIINKVLPGCGFTRFCLETPWENVILCSPRKMLLQNKYEQHSKDVYLVCNELDQDPGIDMDLSREKKVIDKDDPEESHKTKIKAKLHKEFREYMQSHLQHKILVTYDSFRILKEVLEEIGIFQNFFVVVDEFQAIMQDARFKSSTEINFLYHLQNSHSAIFVSATPMLDEYLEELDDFKDLPYYEFDWKTEDFTRIIKPDLDIRKMSSITTEAKKIIEKFRSGNYESATILVNNVPMIKYSTEIVFYVNSVSSIIRIINSNKLTDSEVNILCSNTIDNQKRIWAKLLIGDEKNLPENQRPFAIGRVPLEGEPRKPITLCTRTVYLGADFYSDCAKSYIFSDANSDYLSVDISMDLPQILGRQRCDENPWKNSAVFYYKTTSDVSKLSKEKYEEKIKAKRKSTQDLLDLWTSGDSSQRESFSKTCLNSIMYAHYKDDYVAINKTEIVDPLSGKKSYKMVPVENHLVRISEKRAFDIQKYDYAERFSVFATISKEFNHNYLGSSQDTGPLELQVTEFFKIYDSSTKISDKLRLLCETLMSDKAREIILAQIPDTDKVKYFYQAVGPEKCRANSYSPKRISEAIGIKFFSKKEISNEIYKNFTVGMRISLSDLKSTIKTIYCSIGYDGSPKASDIQKYFNTKKIKLQDPVTGKRVDGLELISKLL